MKRTKGRARWLAWFEYLPWVPLEKRGDIRDQHKPCEGNRIFPDTGLFVRQYPVKKEINKLGLRLIFPFMRKEEEEEVDRMEGLAIAIARTKEKRRRSRKILPLSVEKRHVLTSWSVSVDLLLSRLALTRECRRMTLASDSGSCYSVLPPSSSFFGRQTKCATKVAHDATTAFTQLSFPSVPYNRWNRKRKNIHDFFSFFSLLATSSAIVQKTENGIPDRF